MIYKKNDIVRFISNQPGAHIIEMIGDSELNPEDATQEEYLGRVKSVIGNGEAYVVVTISMLAGLICVLNPDEIIGQVDFSELPEYERQAFNKCSETHEAPNVYNNDPSDLKETMSVEQKCKAVAAKAMKALFPKTKVKKYEYLDFYDYRKDNYIAFLDGYLEMGGKITSERMAELLKKRGEVEAFIRQQRFKEYYVINAGIASWCGTTFWQIAIDMNFEEVSIMRDITERTHFATYLGPEYDCLCEAQGSFMQECFK